MVYLCKHGKKILKDGSLDSGLYHTIGIRSWSPAGGLIHVRSQRGIADANNFLSDRFCPNAEHQ